MKNRVLILTLIAIVAFSCKENSHMISGKINGAPADAYIYLDELKSDAIETVDSVLIGSTGDFKFKRKSDSPVFYMMKATNSSFLTILIDPGEHLKIEADFDSLNVPTKLSGAEGTELMMKFNKELRGAITALQELQDVYMDNLDNPDLENIIGELDERAFSIIDQMEEYTRRYIDDNPTSLASLLALYQQLTPGAPILHPADNFEYFLKVDSILYALYPNSEPVKYFHDQVTEMKLAMSEMDPSEMDPSEMDPSGSIPSSGEIAPEIALPSADGDTIKLSSTRGKIVLLDFWAAWCPPCRKESPFLNRAYDLFHSKGFEIFQVSLDRTREDWLKGIEEDKLGRWIHVSDVMYWNSVVVPLYKIEAIPFNMLLDKEGRIIQTNLRGEQLISTLEAVMNQN
ncbi:MAG: TlpA disulfide reductase family protein [Bacteroidales bacterium]